MGRTSKTFTAATVEETIKKLSEMPEKPKEEVGVSTSDALRMLKPAIKAMQSKGYTLDEILVKIREMGIDVGLTTLKASISKAKTKPKTQEEESPRTKPVNKQKSGTPSAPAFQNFDEK